MGKVSGNCELNSRKGVPDGKVPHEILAGGFWQKPSASETQVVATDTQCRQTKHHAQEDILEVSQWLGLLCNCAARSVVEYLHLRLKSLLLYCRIHHVLLTFPTIGG